MAALQGSVDGTVLVDNGSNLPNGVLLTPCITNVIKEQCILRLTNLTDRNISIPKNIRIAEAVLPVHYGMIDGERTDVTKANTMTVKSMSRDDFLKLFELKDYQLNTNDVNQIKDLLCRNQDVFSHQLKISCVETRMWYLTMIWI